MPKKTRSAPGALPRPRPVTAAERFAQRLAQTPVHDDVHVTPAAVVNAAPRLERPEGSTPHPLLSFGPRHVESGADVVISITSPGESPPQWVLGRLRAESGVPRHLEEGSTWHVAFDPTSAHRHGLRAFRAQLMSAPLAVARDALDARRTVHVHCSEGRIRSASVALLLLATLDTHLSGEELVARLVQMRPQILDGGHATLLEHVLHTLVMDYDLDVPDFENLRWV